MRVLLVCGLLAAISLAGCAGEDADATIQVHFGSSGSSPIVSVDPRVHVFPTLDMYDSSTGPHPGFYSGLDLVEAWSQDQGEDIVYTYWDGLGYTVDKIAGIGGDGNWWAVYVDGLLACGSLGALEVEPGMEVVLRLTSNNAEIDFSHCA